MKTKLLILFLYLISFSFKSKASHYAGGEITWECDSSGDYIFYLNVYRNCANFLGNGSVAWNFTVNRELFITGQTLPRGLNSQSFNRITMMPDITKWVNNNNGVIETECDSIGPKFSCKNLSYGSIELYYYKSLPIHLGGTPPPNGWNFLFEPECCRSQTTNTIGLSVAMVLRVVMYSNLSNDPTDICYDNSPDFAEESSNVFCRGLNYSFNLNGSDKDLQDSISYNLDFALNAPYNSLSIHPYNAGYNHLSPLPNMSFHPGNIPFTLNTVTGNVNFKTLSGIGNEVFKIVIRMDSWRQGKVISSVFREMPYTIIDCGTLPSGSPNNPPNFRLNSTITNAITLNVIAGQAISSSILCTDLDFTGSPNPQNVRILPVGDQFSIDFDSVSYCNNPPCATLSNSTPIYDSTRLSYELNGLAGVATTINWQTDSNHLGPNNTLKSYDFYFNASDGFCPIPAASVGNITINVWPNSTSLAKTKNVESTVELFPNPNTGQFFIKSDDRHSYTIRIRNLQGQVVSKNLYENSNLIQVNLDEKSGIYILEVENELGERFQEKVIKL